MTYAHSTGHVVFDFEKLGQGQMMTFMTKTDRNLVNNCPTDSIKKTCLGNDICRI